MLLFMDGDYPYIRKSKEASRQEKPKKGETLQSSSPEKVLVVPSFMQFPFSLTSLLLIFSTFLYLEANLLVPMPRDSSVISSRRKGYYMTFLEN